MPNFWPLLRANLPIVMAVLVFVGAVQLVAFFMRRFRSSK